MAGKSAACKHLRSLAGGHVLTNTAVLKWVKAHGTNCEAGKQAKAMLQGEIATADLITDAFTCVVHFA
jgi:hypothetical protein